MPSNALPPTPVTNIVYVYVSCMLETYFFAWVDTIVSVKVILSEACLCTYLFFW